jgi:hypothetical protein
MRDGTASALDQGRPDPAVGVEDALEVDRALAEVHRGLAIHGRRDILLESALPEGDLRLPVPSISSWMIA